MSIKKEYSQNKELCKVTFQISKKLGDQFDENGSSWMERINGNTF